MNPQLLPPAFPTSWANEWGEDEFGLYLDCNVNGIVQRFRWIVPGTFTMGSPENEAEREEDETQHFVTLTQGFWLADSTCTQALWLAVMGNNPTFPIIIGENLFDNLSDKVKATQQQLFSNDDLDPSLVHPVTRVSWDDVQKFIQTINAQLPDLQARLPTEAEWEYACRAGTITPFSFGNNITPEQVNYHGEYSYAGAEKGLHRGRTVPVKSLPPNPWGLYEMHGNVWEWCADRYTAYPSFAVIDQSGSVTKEYRSLRGGSWASHAGRVRSAFRDGDEANFNDGVIGFRLALGRKASASQV